MADRLASVSPQGNVEAAWIRTTGQALPGALALLPSSSPHLAEPLTPASLHDKQVKEKSTSSYHTYIYTDVSHLSVTS